MKSRLAKVALVAGGVATLTVGLAGSGNAAILNKLPWNAGTFENKYMPLFDYDTNGCLQKQGEERPRFLAASRHGGYSTHPINEVPRVWGNGTWDQPSLVDMFQMDKAPRDALWNSTWGKANFPLAGKLQANINNARNADSRAKAAIPAF
ncbi:hypothetical protein [Streptomyces fulvoviolaceus]|uniref:hypothetical protein n=1 Tax=Streptomyces fulvoviolaceus TaxID=285535 RepID=UPI0004CC7FAA|nr:hypothetical protein [Streptomyces fulvoviolaceus]